MNSDLQQTAVTVATGKVSVTSTMDKKSVELLPEEGVKITQNAAEKFVANNENYLAWKTGKFAFDKTPLSEVVDAINSYYDDQIVLENKQSDCVLTTSFDNNKLDEAINILEVSCDLQTKKRNNNYVLY